MNGISSHICDKDIPRTTAADLTAITKTPHANENMRILAFVRSLNKPELPSKCDPGGFALLRGWKQNKQSTLENSIPKGSWLDRNSARPLIYSFRFRLRVRQLDIIR